MNAKEKILSEAVKLFAAKGFAETGTDEIVRNSGVAKGLLFYHYQSKEGLLKTVLEKAWEIIRQSSEIEVDNKAPNRSLRTLIRQMTRSLEKEHDYWLVYTVTLLNNNLSEKLDIGLKNPSDVYHSLTINLFKKMGKKNPKHWALSYDIHFRGIVAGYLANPAKFPLYDGRQMMISMFTR